MALVTHMHAKVLGKELWGKMEIPLQEILGKPFILWGKGGGSSTVVCVYSIAPKMIA